MPELEDVDFLGSNRVKELKDKIKKEKDEGERLTLINQLFSVIQSNSESIISKMEDGIHISNFDEVKASLHNEFKNNVKKLLGVLADLKLSNDEQANILLALHKAVERQHDEGFQTIKVKKPSDKTLIANFDEMVFPDSFTLKNVGEITKKLEELKSALNVTVASPQVNVKAPIVNVPKITIPTINVPTPKVTIPESDFNPIIKAIKDLGSKLKNGNTKTEKANTDRMENVSTAMTQAFAGFPGTVSFKSGQQIKVKAPQTMVSGTKAVATAGTAVQVSSTSVPCSYVLVSADLGNTNPVVVGDSNVVAAAGSMQGVVIVPGTPAIRIDINNLNNLWVDSQTNGDDLSYAYFS